MLETKWPNSFCRYSAVFIYWTWEEGYCRRYHCRAAQSLKKRRSSFYVTKAGGFTCSIFALLVTLLTVAETSLCESVASIPSKAGPQSLSICWFQRSVSLWIGFIAPFLSCSCFVLNILLVLATVLTGRIRKKKKITAEKHCGGPFTYVEIFNIVVIYLLHHHYKCSLSFIYQPVQF